MSIALKAFITGALGAVGDKFDEERQATTASLANRTKNAYINYQTYQEQTAALKEEIKKRDSLATSYQEDLTEDERIAIGSDSSNVFLSSYEKVLNAGNPNNRTLRDFIKKKEGASPQNYADWVQASTSKQPDPVAPSLEGSSSFFGTSAAVQRGELDRAAGSVGLSTDQLMAFEKKPDKPMLTPTASLNAEALTMPKSIEDRIEGLRNSLPDATPEGAAAIKSNIEELVAFQNVGLSPKTLTADADRIAMLLKNATGQEEASLRAELAKVNTLIRSNTAAQKEAKQAGGDNLTFPQRKAAVEGAQVSAIENLTGLNQVQRDRLVQIGTDPVTGAETRKMRKLTPADLPIIWKIAKESALQAIKDLGQIKADGTYTQEGIGILIGLGLYSNGKIVEGPTEDTTTEEQRAAQLAASRAAEAAKIQGVGGASKPAAAPATAASLAKARKQAQQAIDVGRDPVAVRKMFKETTGQDL